MNSLSSSLIFGVTLFRNQPGIANNKILGAVGYALVATIAAIESIAAVIFGVISLPLIVLGKTEPLSQSVKWLSSSTFCLGWSIVDFFLNFFTVVLVADERSAREILESGNLMMIPQNAALYFRYQG